MPVERDLSAQEAGVASGRRAPALPMTVAAVAALCLGFWHLNRTALFGSEALSYYAARLDLDGLFRLLHHVDIVHGTYYLLLHFWMSGSTSLVWLRVPSVLGAAAAAGLVALLGTRLLGPRAGVIAGLVYAFSPFVMEYAQDGRSYAIVAALVATTLLALDTAVRDPRPATWARYALALAIAGLLHEFALLASFGAVVSLLLARVSWRVRAQWAVATLCAWAALSPLIVFSTTQKDAIDYLPRPTWRSVGRLVEAYFGATTYVEVAMIVLAVAGLAGLARGRGVGTGHLDAAGLAAPLLVVPPALLLLASVGRQSYFDPRYVAYGTIGVALLVAAGTRTVVGGLRAALRRAPVHGPAPDRPRPVTLAVVVVTATTLVVTQWAAQRRIHSVASRLQDFTRPSQFLAEHAKTGDAVLFFPYRSRAGESAYPGDYRRLADISRAEGPQRSGTFYGTFRPPRAVDAALAAHPRVWLVSNCGFGRGPRGAGGPFGLLRRDYRQGRTHRFVGVCVTLFRR